MLHHIAYLQRRLQTSIWLIPAVFCLAGVLLGLLMLWLDRDVAYRFTSIQMFAMPVESARQVLSVIAGSVISVGGVSFSVTMVALTLTSGQYGPRVLRQFLEDNDSKVSLGLFLGAYVYALVVLTGYVEGDNPHLSVLTALLTALLAVIGFVRFIHRIATDLQADEIVQNIGARLHNTLATLADDSGQASRSCDLRAWRRQARGHKPGLVAHPGNGYVQSIDYDGLVRWCETHDCCALVKVRAGDFLVAGSCAFKVYGCPHDSLEESVDTLNRCIVTGPVRTAAQDPEFPITQLNQLAARALSPGINDPGTAISCVDSFSLALAQIVDRDLPGNVFHDADGHARLLARTTDFEGLLKAVFVPLRQFSQTEVSVIISLLEALGRLAELTTRVDRLGLLGMHGRLIADCVDTRQIPEYDLRDVGRRAARLEVLVGRFGDTKPAHAIR